MLVPQHLDRVLHLKVVKLTQVRASDDISAWLEPICVYHVIANLAHEVQVYYRLLR